MKLTIKQLVGGSDALRRLGAHGIKELTQKVFYNVNKNIRAIAPELELYEKMRQSIINQYSSAQQNGEYGIHPRDIPVVNAEIEEAQAREVDIPILVCSLTDKIIESAEIKAADLFALEWMFELPESE